MKHISDMMNHTMNRQMMEPSTTKEDLIRHSAAYDTLNRIPRIGWTFETLYEACDTYPGRTDLSKDLNRLTIAKLIQRRGVEYFSMTAIKSEPTSISDQMVLRVEDTIASLLPPTEHTAGETTTGSDEPQPLAVDVTVVPMGNLQRSSAHKRIALAFYYNRDKPLSSDTLVATGLKYGIVYSVVRRLVERGYVEKVGDITDRQSVHRWSGKFKYPFQHVMRDDASWGSIIHSPSDAGVLPTHRLVGGAPEGMGVRCEPLTVVPAGMIPLSDDMLVGIDAVIGRYTMEITALQAIRAVYVASKTQEGT